VNSALAPIAFFAYKRPQHTLCALEALSRCALADASRLVVFCDGPKRPEDAEAVRQVREVVKSRQWCGTVEVVEREQNVGLANSITSGVSDLCREYGRVIVLEDDLIVSPYFLRYMNDALERYKDEERVMQISGYMFDVQLHAETDAILLPFASSWGWATWQRAWGKYDAALSGYAALKNDRQLRRAFNYEGRYDFFQMLEMKISGKLDSWAIVWYLTIFINRGLVLSPVKTLVHNAGFDGSGTHCGEMLGCNKKEFDEYQGDKIRFPNEIQASELRYIIYPAVIGVNSTSYLVRIVSKINRYCFKVFHRVAA
jgi:hypothetical protein